MHWDLAKVVLPAKSAAKSLDMWDRITVRSCLVVELSIITTRSPFTILLLNHLQRGCPYARRRSDNAHVDELGKFSFRACKLFWRKKVCSIRPGRAVVMIRCVTPWRIGMSLVYGVVREGNSLKSWVYGSLLVSGVEILLKS